MSVQRIRTRTAVTIVLATTAALLAAAVPAVAAPAPEPPDQSVPVQLCPRIDDLAAQLRAAGFASQGAKNFAVFTREDCLAEI